MSNRKEYIILIEVDKSCQMARVSCKYYEGMEGNFWDFHPGCHGIEKYGDFKGHEGFANAIYRYLVDKKKINPSIVSIVRKEYTY